MDALPVQVSGRRRISLVPVKENRHLLQSMSASFRVIEVDDETHDDEHSHKDEVVLPSNRFQSNRVDERVEENGRESGAPRDSQATGPKAVRPDLTGVGAEEGGPGMDLLAVPLVIVSFSFSPLE